VDYLNAHAKLVDPHTVEFTLKGENGELRRLSAANIVIAVGGRPLIPSDIPGALEHAITSDDIFFLPRSPGRTLCVGGSYIALECAGFLTELGYDVIVAARSTLLRDFDRQCAEKIRNLMVDLGTNILLGVQPTSITKQDSGKLLVTFVDSIGQTTLEQFDTVFFATGRVPDLKGLDLPLAGVKISQSGKIRTFDERTNVSHIYAVGDVCDGKQELTPVAIRAGNLLARRLYGGSTEKMDYEKIATTVFTPYEYGCVGLSEEAAIELYGADDIDVSQHGYVLFFLCAWGLRFSLNLRIIYHLRVQVLCPSNMHICLVGVRKRVHHSRARSSASHETPETRG
jgi:thioredoxin reductase (NADPH)